MSHSLRLDLSLNQSRGATAKGRMPSAPTIRQSAPTPTARTRLPLARCRPGSPCTLATGPAVRGRLPLPCEDRCRGTQSFNERHNARVPWIARIGSPMSAIPDRSSRTGRRFLAHSVSPLRCAHCPAAGVERTLTGGGESDENDPFETFERSTERRGPCSARHQA
jgi:hypothetical protein